MTPNPESAWQTKMISISLFLHLNSGHAFKMRRQLNPIFMSWGTAWLLPSKKGSLVTSFKENGRLTMENSVEIP